MLHIHYTKGPEVLRDVSMETYNAILEHIKLNEVTSSISQQFAVSEDVVESIHSIASSRMRRCCFCGKVFDPKGRTRANTCEDEHYLPCIDCGAPVKVNESYANYMKAGGRRCAACRGNQISNTRRNKSEEEKRSIVAKQEATMLEKYGARNALQVAEIKERVHATVKERYGVDNLSQSEAIQAKIRENSQKRFGVDHYSNDPTIRRRMLDGMIEKYGVAYPMQNEELMNKIKTTNLERYGCENVFQNENVRATFVANHFTKYGVAWPHQRPDLIEQVKQANIKKYGAAMRPVSDEYMQQFISDPSKFDNYKSFITDPEAYILEHYVNKPSVKQLSEDLGVTDSPIYERLISIGRRDLATEYCYSMETQLVEFLMSLNPNLSIEMHNRSILDGKEIDVLLPTLNIGFECNPTYTHNSSFLDPWGSPPKSYTYHADKSKSASAKGVFLYHIFGYEWNHRRSVIQSQIRNLIGANESTVYARKTLVEEVSYAEACQFLDMNHRQGAAQSKIRLGLKSCKTGELVSLMTFGKMRDGIGKKSNNNDNDWELIRFCNKLNTSVVGGASKLFNHFVKNYNPAKIVSFSDIAHTKGTLYEILGFEAISISDPGYVWVNMSTDEFFSRMTCQKHNLPRLFDDVTEADLATKSEAEIMMAHDYARVFDSGVIRWEYAVR